MSTLDNSFDAVAKLYDSVRPSYPRGLFDRVIEFARLAPSARLLEVGAGTGKATVGFAERGFPILCLEPGSNMARVARSRLARFPRVDVEMTSFEDWDAPSNAFDVAYVAQAFHWLKPDGRLEKLARVLKHSGTVAIFGNSPTVPEGELHDAIEMIYDVQAPALRRQDHACAWYASPTSPVMAELRQSSDFEDVRYETYSWERTLGAEEYCQLLRTYSDHAALGAEQLENLLAAMKGALVRHGGTVTVHYRTGLFLARARSV